MAGTNRSVDIWPKVLKIKKLLFTFTCIKARDGCCSSCVSMCFLIGKSRDIDGGIESPESVQGQTWRQGLYMEQTGNSSIEFHHTILAPPFSGRQFWEFTFKTPNQVQKECQNISLFLVFFFVFVCFFVFFKSGFCWN